MFLIVFSGVFFSYSDSLSKLLKVPPFRHDHPINHSFFKSFERVALSDVYLNM